MISGPLNLSKSSYQENVNKIKSKSKRSHHLSTADRYGLTASQSTFCSHIASLYKGREADSVTSISGEKHKIPTQYAFSAE